MFQQSLKLSEANVLPQGYCKLSNTCTTATSELVTKTALQQQQRPLYRSTCVNQHLQNWRICWCKVLVPACPCWWQPAHSDYGENAGVLNSVIYTVSVPLSLKRALKYQNVANNDDQSRKQSGTSVAIFTAVKILWAWLRMNFVSADGDTSSFNPPT